MDAVHTLMLENWFLQKEPEKWEQAVSDENQWRRAFVKKAGCTEKEIEEQLPVLTVEKVLSRGGPPYRSFVEAARS